MLKREVLFNIGDISYVLKFPKVIQYLEIESEKVRLSTGTYGGILSSGSKFSDAALDLIDMISVFKVLCPKIFDDMKVDPINLDLEDSVQLLGVYKKEVHPWYMSCMDLFKKVGEDQKLEDESSKK